MPEDIKPINQPQIVINQQIPFTYVNGTAVALAASDLQITLAINGRAFNTLLMNHSVAKSLQTSLGNALNDFEEKTGTKINDIIKINDDLRPIKK